MKVLQVAPGYIDFPSWIGGAVEKHIMQISEELKQLGVDVIIAARQSKQKRSGIIYLPPPAGDQGILNKIVHSAFYSINLRRLLSIEKFDIIHIHGGIAGLFQSHLLPKEAKIVLTVHNLQLFSTNPFMRGLASFMEFSSCKRVDAVIAVSKHMKRLLSARLKDVHVEYIPNGVDIKNQFVNRAEIKTELGFNESKVVLFVGRIIPEKGVHILVKAIKELETKYGMNNFKLIMVGPPGPSFLSSSSPYFRNIMRLIKDLNLTSSVKYMGVVGDSHLKKLYASADLFVFPSIYEAMSLVVLEAMAAGTPIVASRTGGVPDVVKDGKTGILVRPGDYQALAEAIYRVLTNPRLSKSLSINALKFVQSNLSWSKVAERILALYKSIT